MKRRARALSVAGLLASLALNAYVRETSGSRKLTRTAFVSFYAGPHIKAGLKNGAGQTVITPESDPMAALQAAMDTWNNVPGGGLNLSLTAVASDFRPANDGRNVVMFEDTPANRSIVGSAIAVTYYYYERFQGEIIDSDIVFNPDMVFATTPTLGAFDLQSIATHEIGHAIGVGHTPLMSAVMFPYGEREDTAHRILSSDEIAFVRDTHPREPVYGGISGSVSQPDNVPLSALILALSRDGGVTAGAYTNTGDYEIAGLTPGDYLIAAYPVPPYLASSSSDVFDTPDWQGTFAGQPGATTPQVVTVSSGAAAKADIAVPAGSSKLSIDMAMFGDDFSEDRVPSGRAVPVGMVVTGLTDKLASEDIAVYGGGATVRADSIEVYASEDPADAGVLLFVLDVPERTDWADAAIVVRSRLAAGVYGGIRIAPSGASFTPSGVANAASFDSGPLAPGELVAIFGSGIGPDKGAAAPADEHGFPTEFEDTVVEIADRPAPLIYVSSSQINAQVPFEVAGQASAKVRVRYKGTTAEGILPVADASPATFGSYSQSAILNEDGSLNNEDHPALRGKAVIIFGTGQGAVDPPLATNAIAGSSPLSVSPNVKATLGGKTARVDWAGMTPGFVGLWQVNMTVPDDAPGGWARLLLTVNDSFNAPADYVYVSTQQ